MPSYGNPTAEQIAKATDHAEGRANRRAIFAAYRAADDSHLWPICGRFSVVERAIRQQQRYERHYGPSYGIELCYAIDARISDIVNGANR